jgi:RHS repeat-associated protein
MKRYIPRYPAISAHADADLKTTAAQDRAGNLHKMTDADGAVITYDEAGNMIAVADPDGVTIRLAYDAQNRLNMVTDAAGNSTTYEYDTCGNRTRVTDANGNATRTEYDRQGRLVRIIDALGHTTSLTYAGAVSVSGRGAGDKLGSLTDANGNTTTFDYDSQGRLVAETDPLGNATRFGYDSGGKVISRTDANGDTISLIYDDFGRLIEKRFPDNSTTIFAYDAKGRLANAANQHISYEMVYDAAGRLLSRTDSSGRTVAYLYDALGNRVQMITPEGRKVSYAYNQVNRLARIDSWAGAFGFAYGSSGRRSALSYPNGIVTSFIFDHLGNLAEILAREGSDKHQLIAAFIYTHDHIGNRLSKTVLDRQHQGIRYEYIYDPVYQLLKSTPVKLEGNGKAAHLAETFTYDPVGNRLAGPKAAWSCLYNQANQLLKDRQFRYQHDANGNLTGKTGSAEICRSRCCSYAYDYDHRLIGVKKEEGGKTTFVSYKYDPFGRRIEKRIEELDSQGKRVEIYNYFYDEEDIILEFRTSSAGGGEKIETTRFLHGPGLDEPLAVGQEDALFFCHTDGLGSITSLTDTTGWIVQSCDYSAFGYPRHQGNLIRQPFAFAGREWDRETGLYFYRARYYDPETGRYLSRDSIGLAGGDENLYRAVENNPVNLTDRVKSSIFCKQRCRN